ncbi:15172_t:CDS:2, partial [Gigaspora margarita]
MNQTQAQIIDPIISEIDWTNKLNEYKNVFALSTEEFKKFAVTQNEKVSGKDKEIVQLLKTDANIVLAVTTKQEEVTKKVLIKQEYGCQDYGIQELTNKIPNLEAEKQNNSKGLEIKAEEQRRQQPRIWIAQKFFLNSQKQKTEQTRAQSTSSQNKQCKIVEKNKVTTKQEEKLKEYKQGCSGSRDQDLKTTRNITYKKKGKAKQ